ncbi:MAG: Ppx/GppA family phosphatase [Bdellovibrionales bacterium]|nr:Ppx/GppA family phosphatase [Bdellovibrionales bacterium]
MLRSSIDLGTNTCLLLVAEWDASSKTVTRTQLDRSEIVRLGQGVDQNRMLHPDAMKRTLDCLKQYAQDLKALGLNPADTVAVATSQARDSSNGAKFFKEVQATTGFKFQILTGDDEAKYTFQGGLLPGMNPEKAVVIDIGGGSTEFMSTIGGKSLDLGSVRFTERFLKSDPVTDEEFWAAQAAIDQELQVLEPWRDDLDLESTLLGVAGTVTSLAQWQLDLPQFDAAKIDQVTLSRGDVHRMVEELKWRTIQERKEIVGMEPKRADVLLAGALILWRAMEVLDFSEVRVSTRGLRYGILNI